ncbi:unnamed protein product [Pedinophyceae sp. YPF-701]|nr:unnamed protein product [Pedinophyceae sp. YPF-701]
MLVQQLSSKVSTSYFQRSPRLRSQHLSRSRRSFATYAMVNVEQLKGAKAACLKLVAEKNCGPILIRAAWHDAGTFDKAMGLDKWPTCGGANGSIRHEVELGHAANAGLVGAIKLLQPIKDQFPEVGWADLLQMSSACAIEGNGGPAIPMQYGRVDSGGPEQCVKEGNLPGAKPPFPNNEATPAEHLRNVFHRMGLSDKDIVALSGAHTMGRAYSDRSGANDKPTTRHTEKGVPADVTPKGGETPGGQSWTADWLKFNNHYFVDVKERRDADLLVLPTDACLFEDPGFKPHAEKYAASQEDFFKEYAESHKALSELGVKWEDGAPVTI